jgi:hypothetical protein
MGIYESPHNVNGSPIQYNTHVNWGQKTFLSLSGKRQLALYCGIVPLYYIKNYSHQSAAIFQAIKTSFICFLFVCCLYVGMIVYLKGILSLLRTGLKREFGINLNVLYFWWVRYITIP